MNSSPFASLGAHFDGKTGMTLIHIAPSLCSCCLFRCSLSRRCAAGIRDSTNGLAACSCVLELWPAVPQCGQRHPVGGIVEETATTVYGCFSLFSLSRAWLHVCNRRVELHQEWVIRTVAIALGGAAPGRSSESSLPPAD